MTVDERIAALERLADLHENGILNDEEFAKEKAKVLLAGRAEQSITPDERNAPPPDLYTSDSPDSDEQFDSYTPSRTQRQWWLFAAVAGLATIGLASAFWWNSRDQRVPIGEDGLPILDNLIVVSDPQRCNPFETIPLPEADLTSLNISGVGAVDIDKKYLKKYDLIELSLRLKGTWQGLRVNRIMKTYRKDSDFAYYEIRFLEDRNKVFNKLKGIGFPDKINDMEEGYVDLGPDLEIEGLECKMSLDDANGGSSLIFNST